MLTPGSCSGPAHARLFFARTHKSREPGRRDSEPVRAQKATTYDFVSDTASVEVSADALRQSAVKICREIKQVG